ncbi:MAG: rRNA maturation RNAse YbeY [bacterium]|nr:rRNA maturation RNAse YbeY [bacterium]
MVSVFTNGFEVDEKCVQDVVESTMSEHGVSGKYEVNVNFVVPDEMQTLYDKQRHDVLSFPLEGETGPDGVVRYGDIVVLGTLSASRRDMLIAHSCLHLLGIHHED